MDNYGFSQCFIFGGGLVLHYKTCWISVQDFRQVKIQFQDFLKASHLKSVLEFLDGLPLVQFRQVLKFSLKHIESTKQYCN